MLGLPSGELYEKGISGASELCGSGKNVNLAYAIGWAKATERTVSSLKAIAVIRKTFSSIVALKSTKRFRVSMLFSAFFLKSRRRVSMREIVGLPGLKSPSQ